MLNEAGILLGPSLEAQAGGRRLKSYERIHYNKYKISSFIFSVTGDSELT